jgi:hypothetical protein
VVPEGFTRVRLSNLPYRDMTLDITVTGTGDTVTSCAVDGVAQSAIPTTLTGRHRVDLTVADGPSPRTR